MKQTILVVEDDATAARLLELVLAREGYQMLSAPDGLEGLEQVGSRSVDLILLDLMLPGMDGLEVLEHLKSTPRTADIPVLVISAKSRPTDKVMAIKVGADAYLTKPYTADDLLDAVRSLLRKRQAIAARGRCALLVGPQMSEVARVTQCLGLALIGKGETVTVADMCPFSMEHPRLLGVPPRPAPIALSDPQTASQLGHLMVHHSSGLRLLNNLEGSGETGQLTPENAKTVLDALLAQDGFVLVNLPLHVANALLRSVVHYCALVLLVIWGHPASLAAARSALALFEKAGIEPDRISIVPIGVPEQEFVAEFGQAAVSSVTIESGPDAPAFQALADRLRGLRQAYEGDTRNVA